MQQRRLGIFVFHDRDGFVAEYVEYLLAGIGKVLSELVVVCNGGLSDEGRGILEKYADEIVFRDNTGFDFAAWKAVLTRHLGWEKVAEYDEIVFFNNSFYGPIYQFEEMFDEMDTRTADFWGAVKHPAARGIFEHIQSYFFVTRKSLHTGECFKEYWESLPEAKTMKQAIGIETRQTKYFTDRGYSCCAYIDTEDEKFSGFDPTVYWTTELVCGKRLPMIKRKIFTEYKRHHLSNGGTDISGRTLEYIDRHTDYDVGMIWRDMLKRSNIRDIYESLHLDYILPSRLAPTVKNAKVAVVIYMFYGDMFDYCHEYAKNIPESVDLIIAVPKEHAKAVKEMFSDIACAGLRVVSTVNRGRDVAALLVECGKSLLAYDLICFVHDKKSLQVASSIGRGFCDLLFENTLGSREYIQNVIDLFDKEKFLGYVGVPPYMHGEYYTLMGSEWAYPGNCRQLCELLKSLDVTVPISCDTMPISTGTAFWCRPQAIAPLLNRGWSYDDFDPEPLPPDGTINHAVERAFPYVAQSCGYYSGIVMSDKFASVQYSDSQYLLREVIKLRSDRVVGLLFMLLVRRVSNTLLPIGTKRREMVKKLLGKGAEKSGQPGTA